METDTEAARWRKRGVIPIPLLFKTKRPLVKWTQWVDRDPPDALWESWFRLRGRNLGIVLKNRMVALDFDNAGAYFSWKKSAPEDVSRSLTIKSNRGWHVYVRTEVEFTKIAAMEKGGEIRGKGIMVVPPSFHPAGTQYKVWIENEIVQINDVNDLGIEFTESCCYGHGQYESMSSSEGCGDGVISKILKNMPIQTYLGRFTKILWNGSCFIAQCPFHNDSNPSLQVNIEDGWAYCHSPNCPAHRRCTVIDIAMLTWNRPLNEILFILANELE